MLLGVLVVLGALLRAAPIVDRPLSLDEALTWRTAGSPWADFLTWSHHPDHPPLSFLLVRGSTSLTGSEAEWALRLPAVIAGTLSIPAAAWAGGAFAPAAGIVLAALVAVDPVQVEQARTARMYPLLALLLLAAAGTARRVGEGRGRHGAWLLLGGLLGAAVWTHAMGALFCVAVLVALPFADRPARPRLAAAAGLAAALAIPGVIAVQRGAFGARGRPETLEAVGGQWTAVAGGILEVLGSGGWGGVIVLAGLAGLLVRFRRAPVAAAFLMGVAVLVTAAVLMAAPERAYGVGRYLIPVRLAVFAGLAALTAGIARPSWRRLALGSVTALGLVFARAALPDGVPADHRIGGVARALAPELAPKTPVVFRPAYLRHVGAYYGIRPAVAEGDSGLTWILIQDDRLLRPESDAALSGEVRRRLPPAAASRGQRVDLEDLDRRLRKARALAVGIDETAIRVVDPDGRWEEVETESP